MADEVKIRYVQNKADFLAIVKRYASGKVVESVENYYKEIAMYDPTLAEIYRGFIEPNRRIAEYCKSKMEGK